MEHYLPNWETFSPLSLILRSICYVVRRLLLIVIGFIPFTLYSQTDEAVYLQKSTHLEIALDGTSLRIKEINFLEKQFNSQFSKHSQKSIFYSDFDPIIAFEAETAPPKGGKKTIKVSTSDTHDIVQPGIFYGGYKRKEFVFPAIQTGSIGRLNYTKEIKDPHLLTPYYFGEDVIVQASKFSVAVPTKVSLQYKIFGVDPKQVKYEEQFTKDGVLYSWTMSGVKPWEFEKDAPGRAHTAPHIVFYINHYEVSGEKRKLLSDVSDLYSWYNTLIQRIPSQKNDTELRALVSDLTSGVTSEHDKIRAIFHWVQKNIRYIAFEDGMAGLIPRSATDVFIKRYGDCKDMANLLKFMINIAGLDAYHTWIGTRDRPYSYADVPTVIADNHMICSIKLDNSWVFLDATNPFIAFGKPTSMIQGKEALIGIDENKYEVVRVPVVEKEINSRIDTLFVLATDKGIKGRMVSQLTGYRKDDLEVKSMRAALNQDEQYIRDYFNIGNNDIQIQQVALSGFGDQSRPGQIAFEFVQPGYLKKIGDKVYLNLGINKTTPGDKIDISTRLSPIERDYHYHDATVTVFEIPADYEITYLPKKKSAQWPEFGCTTSYEVKDGKIFFVRELYSNHLYLNSEKFETWNAFVQELAAVNNQTITLSLKH
jgi:hypothetical protein